MNNSFEQQFTQNVQQTALADKQAPKRSGLKLSWIIIISLVFVILLQTIAIIIILTNFTSSETTNEIDTGTSSREDVNSVFDSEGYVSSFNAICISSDGAYYKFFKTNKYEQYNNSNNLINSGDYSMANGSIISVSPNKTLYYEGYFVADGTTIYDCEADTNPESAK